MVTFHPIADRFHPDMVTFHSTFALLQGFATFASHVMTTPSIALENAKTLECTLAFAHHCHHVGLLHYVIASLVASSHR
ncbi:hypothetical protein B296_00003455 [Ensete ventricosum]|uniref:Uncharacterized protein n=1 Tax=Ensete ventricosum TaxID=4639 RepID=A0A427AMK9_ENSVE|nr:hypothetical protein B296_00003455 [Ensete ventricosum]